MRYGTGFPLTAFDDRSMVRDFAQTLDGAGFDYVTAAGHVLSQPAGRFSDRPAPTYSGPFYDPFVLFSFLSAVTDRLRFRTAILILPLFPTVLVAKQSAELAQFSGERFDLGVGISWSGAEYQAMNQELRTRGARIEEQILVLRRLWSEPFVSFDGRWHHLDAVGLNRLPKKPISIWMGAGTNNPILRRVARLADGWLPQVDPAEPLARLRRHLSEAGRDANSLRIQFRLLAGDEGPPGWIESAKRLNELGVTDLSISAPAEMNQPAALNRIVDAKQRLVSEIEG